jgi:hypothetical protein
MGELVNRRIVCAAMINMEGVIIPSPRHFDRTCHELLEIAGLEGKNCNWLQGFIDQHGKFYDRKEAFILAVKNKQIFRPTSYETNELYSENLY